ncbi:MAG: hypothetical protein AB3N64_13935 [Puniceicoccaceae bacterium]
MLSLAPLRYSKVLNCHGGPIEYLEHGPVTIQGRQLQQASAYLSRYLNLRQGENQVFANADGTGTDASPMVARHKAISEALERWAFHYICQQGQHASHGFQDDDTTSGIAAFPGLFKGSARERARLEAEERYCLVQWWNRCLEHQPLETKVPGFSAVRINNPISEAAVVLCWRMGPCGWTGYGTAAAVKVRDSLWKATIELERAIVALEFFNKRNPRFSETDLPALGNHLERRLLHYAFPYGHAVFRERLKMDVPSPDDTCPEPLVDNEIRGPWENYATVWRTLYPSRSKKHLDPRVMTFFW